jgi:hypothetical protein
LYINRTVKHGKPNQLESGKYDRPLLAGLALGVDVVNERENVGIEPTLTRRQNERETLVSNQRNPRNGIKGSVGIEPTQPERRKV